LGDLLKTEDFRKYEALWRYMAYARKFMEKEIPFAEMEPVDNLLTGASEYQGKNNLVTGQVFAKKGECYAIYLPVAEKTGTLDLTSVPRDFTQRWYNPRTGEFSDQETPVRGGTKISLGAPPADPGEDWVILIK